MKCTICELENQKGLGTSIALQNNKMILICPECHEDVYENGTRFTVDIMVVPVSHESFSLAINNRKYIIPSRYLRKYPKFIAFYRGNNINAITHISKVRKITNEVTINEIMDIYNTNKKYMWMNDEQYIVFDLENVLKLKNNINRDKKPPIQNRTYKSFKTFSKAKALIDLK